jgi:hypothetical protein
MFSAPFPSNRSLLLVSGSHKNILLLRNLTTGHREPSSQCCLLDCLENCCRATSCNIRSPHGLPIVVMQFLGKVFTKLLPNNAFIKSVTVWYSQNLNLYPAAFEIFRARKAMSSLLHSKYFERNFRARMNYVQGYSRHSNFSGTKSHLLGTCWTIIQFSDCILTQSNTYSRKCKMMRQHFAARRSPLTWLAAAQERAGVSKDGDQ